MTLIRKTNFDRSGLAGLPCRFGVTLVEVLVTTAIIGLLASVLLPAISRASDKSRLLVCRVHLRNVTIATLVYADDNNDFLPIDGILGPSYQGFDNPHTALIQALQGYVGDRYNYFCPSSTDPKLCFSQQNLQADVIGYFYYSCQSPSTNRDVHTYLRWTISWPRYLRTTMDSGTWVISDSWFRGRPTSHRGYRKGVNYAVLDGSVKMLYKSPRKAFK